MRNIMEEAIPEIRKKAASMCMIKLRNFYEALFYFTFYYVICI